MFAHRSSSSSGTNFWDAAVEFQKRKASGRSGDPTLIILGSQGSGKTTLVSTLIHRSPPNDVCPTVGLDYKYMRASLSGDSSAHAASSSSSKLVSHFWELGGGRQMSPALSTLVTSRSAILVLVDLSRLNTIVPDLLFWLPHIQKATKARSLPQASIIVIANKYDAIPVGSNTDLISRTIRAIAVHYRAAVVSHAVGNRPLHQQLRSFLMRFILDKSTAQVAIQMDPMRPLMIPPGSDSFEAIGLPTGATGLDPCAIWCRQFRQTYPDSGKTSVAPSDPSDIKLEAEPTIDSIWLQKLEERKRLQPRKPR